MMLRILVVLSAATMTAAAPIPKSMKNAKKSFLGRWTLVEENYSQRPTLRGNFVQEWDIGVESMQIYADDWPGVPESTLYKLFVPPDEVAGALDWSIGPKDGSSSPVVYKGLVRIEGDAMEYVCSGGPTQPRPEKIEPAPQTYYYRFERSKGK